MSKPDPETGLFGSEETNPESKTEKAPTIPPRKKADKAASSKSNRSGSKTEGRKSDQKPVKKVTKPTRDFPIVGLDEALKIAQAIRQKNGGRPLDTDLVATAYGLARSNNKFYYATTASRDYGLTIGTRDTAKIELAELGRSLVYATSQDEEKAFKVEAFFRVVKFKQVYDYYGGSGLPEDQYLANALENEFGIHPDHHSEFVEVFKSNCQYLGIENGIGTRVLQSPSSDNAGLDTRSMGKPKGEFDRTAFVIMPFSEKGKQERSKGFFDEVLKSVITPAANAAGFAVETARQEDSDIIHHTIINRLLNDELVICDLTDHNPNVLFELGIRLAKEKPVVLIKSKDTGPIFDVDNMLRVYIYDQNLWKSTVEADVKGLTDRIKGTWENTENTVGYMRILTTSPHAVRQ